MAVVNKVHIQVWNPLQLHVAPYIVTHNHPYKSSSKPDLLRSTAATYVGMVMCDNVGYYSCNGIHTCTVVRVCVLCLPLPSLHLFDFYDLFLLLVKLVTTYMSACTCTLHVCNTYNIPLISHSLSAVRKVILAAPPPSFSRRHHGFPSSSHSYPLGSGRAGPSASPLMRQTMKMAKERSVTTSVTEVWE